MARYDLPLLDQSTMQKLMGNYNQLSDQVLSQRDIDQLMASYGGMEDRGLQDAYHAAQMEASKQYSPAFDAIRARNYGLYGEGAGINRDYSNSLSSLMGDLTSRRFSLAADVAARKAAALRTMGMQRWQNRANLGGQLYEHMLSAKKKPTFGQQLASGALQLGGAVLGAKLGGAPSGMYGASAPADPTQYRTDITAPANMGYEEDLAKQQLQGAQPRYNTIPMPNYRRGY